MAISIVNLLLEMAFTTFHGYFTELVRIVKVVMSVSQMKDF